MPGLAAGGAPRSPVALGFWAAVREVFPETREQRCWFHKIANALNALPKSAQPGAKAALAEIWNAEDNEHAEAAAKAFAADYGTTALSLTCGEADHPDEADRHPHPESSQFRPPGWVSSARLAQPKTRRARLSRGAAALAWVAS